MKKIGLFGLMIVAVLLLQAHEFWLEPTKFKVNPGEELAVNFKVGENFTGQAWDLGKNRVEKMVLFEKGPMQDILSKVPSAKGEKLKVKLNNPGTKIIAMKSNAAYIELDAEKFNLYLKEDGLEDVYDWRVKNGQDSLGAKEFYTRYSKLIVQCGDQLDDSWKKQAGHRLEITPDSNPGSLKPGDYMSCKVTYEKKPAKHITVKVWGHVGNKIFLQNIYSEDDGSIKFPISASGPWMVSAVRMEKSKDPKADWESSWASLVFNID
jgi:uncharacterized GH25 family protein